MAFRVGKQDGNSAGFLVAGQNAFVSTGIVLLSASVQPSAPGVDGMVSRVRYLDPGGMSVTSGDSDIAAALQRLKTVSADVGADLPDIDSVSAKLNIRALAASVQSELPDITAIVGKAGVQNIVANVTAELPTVGFDSSRIASLAIDVTVDAPDISAVVGDGPIRNLAISVSPDAPDVAAVTNRIRGLLASVQSSLPAVSALVNQVGQNIVTASVTPGLPSVNAQVGEGPIKSLDIDVTAGEPGVTSALTGIQSLAVSVQADTPTIRFASGADILNIVHHQAMFTVSHNVAGTFGKTRVITVEF